MAHTGIFATSAECLSKTGATTSASATTEANINQWCAEAESFINATTRNNWSDDYSTLNTDVKKILTEACTCLVGIYAINYDMSVYANIVEAENRISVLAWRLSAALKKLEDQDVKKFIEGE